MNRSRDNNDEQLILAFQQGDEGAFDLLYERHHRSVFNTAYRLLGNRDTAEDIAQEVFVKLYSSPGNYRPVARFTTWLYRITCNACIDEGRKRRRRPSQIADYALISVSDGGSSPEATAEANEMIRTVQSAIASLPEKQRIAVILQRYEGLSYQEIADVLQTSVSAVESLLFRARESLKVKLAHCSRRHAPSRTAEAGLPVPGTL